MADLFLLSQAQMRRIKCYFPRSHGVARVDDRRIVSAIVFVIKNGLRWRDAPRDRPAQNDLQSVSFAGAVWACSTRFSPSWLAPAASRSGS